MHPSHAFVQAPTRGSRELEDKPKAQHPISFEQYATALHFAQRSGGGIRVTLQCALLQNSVRLAGLSARPRPSGSMRTGHARWHRYPHRTRGTAARPQTLVQGDLSRHYCPQELERQRPVLASKAPVLPCTPLCSGARTSELTFTRSSSWSMWSEPACMPTTCAPVLHRMHVWCKQTTKLR